MVARVWRGITKGPSALALRASRVHSVAAACLRLLRPHRTHVVPRKSPMSPPRETTGSAGTHQQPQQHDAPGLQPKVHLPQRDHGRGLVLPDTRGAQSRGGRPRRALGAVIFPTVAPRSIARAGNAEAYYPHFQFDSNYTYGMVHRE